MKNRRFRRIPFAAEVKVQLGESCWAAELLDVAMKGALIGSLAELPLSIGAQPMIIISLPGTTISLDFKAELVHAENQRYGFKFLSENLETLGHLRKMIELNTGDAETTRSELSSWLKD